MKKLLFLVSLLMFAAPILVLAQEDAVPPKKPTLLERVQKAAEIITASEEAREAGIPEEDVQEVLKGARERGLSAGETGEVLTESTEAVKESGPVDNFGAFVEAKLDEGLRGKELAQAIREEHRRHGKGKGHGKKEDRHDGKREKHQGKKHEQAPDQRDHDDDVHDDDDDGHEGRGKKDHKKKGK